MCHPSKKVITSGVIGSAVIRSAVIATALCHPSKKVITTCCVIQLRWLGLLNAFELVNL